MVFGPLSNFFSLSMAASMKTMNAVLDFVCRFGLFDVQDRCFVTFLSDTLTVPLPNNSYQIYYTPVNDNTSKKSTFVL